MMKKSAFIAALALSLGIVACPVEESTVEGTITLADSESPFIAFDIWVKAGSQDDPAGKEGLAAITANMLANSSTTEDSYEQILEKLYPMAAGYSYDVDKEMTVFRGRIHKDNLQAYYTLFKNAVLSPAFLEEDFNRIKTQTLTYLQQGRRYARDEELSKELLFREIYRGTPYEHPEEGYVTSMESITLDDVKDFYTNNYLGNNIVVGIAGGYPDGFVQKVREDFNTLPDGEVAQVAKPEPAAIDGIHVLIVEKQTAASAISFGFPIPLLRSDDDFYAMMLVNSWFGEHRNSFSHLYQVIRETRGMNYGDYSYVEAYPRGYTTQVPPTNVSRRSQIFEVWIRPISMTAPGTLHDRTLFATRAAMRELKKLVDNGITEETFEKTRNFLHNYTVNWATTIIRRLAYKVDDVFYGINGDGFLAGIRPGLEALSLEQVNSAIARNLQFGNFWLILITNDAEGMKQKLLSGEPTNITYASEQPQAVLDEDLEIASFPIPVKEENIHIIPIDEVFEK